VSFRGEGRPVREKKENDMEPRKPANPGAATLGVKKDSEKVSGIPPR